MKTCFAEVGDVGCGFRAGTLGGAAGFSSLSKGILGGIAGVGIDWFGDGTKGGGTGRRCGVRGGDAGRSGAGGLGCRIGTDVEVLRVGGGGGGPPLLKEVIAAETTDTNGAAIGGGAEILA